MLHVCRVHCDRVIDFDQGLVCFSLGRDDSDVATGVNYGVASSSGLSESICNLVIPKWPSWNYLSNVPTRLAEISNIQMEESDWFLLGLGDLRVCFLF